MATEDMCVYDLYDEFNELFRNVEMEETSYVVICAGKDPTTRNGMVVAAVRGVTGKQMLHGAGSCHEPGHPIQHNEGVCHTESLKHGKVLKQKTPYMLNGIPFAYSSILAHPAAFGSA